MNIVGAKVYVGMPLSKLEFEDFQTSYPDLQLRQGQLLK